MTNSVLGSETDKDRERERARKERKKERSGFRWLCAGMCKRARSRRGWEFGLPRVPTPSYCTTILTLLPERPTAVRPGGGWGGRERERERVGGRARGAIASRFRAYPSGIPTGWARRIPRMGFVWETCLREEFVRGSLLRVYEHFYRSSLE